MHQTRISSLNSGSKREFESESQIYRKHESYMDETAFRRTTATSEEDDHTWVRIRKEELNDLRDRARDPHTHRDSLFKHDSGATRH